MPTYNPWPYAAKAQITYQFDTDHLDIWVTFRYAMKILTGLYDPLGPFILKPPDATWLIELDAVPTAIDSSDWLDTYTMHLFIDSVAAAPEILTVEYDGPDEGLRTIWDKQWEAFGPIVGQNVDFYTNTPTFDSINIAGPKNVVPFILSGTITNGSTDTIYNANAPIAFKVIDAWANWIGVAAGGFSVFASTDASKAIIQMIIGSPADKGIYPLSSTWLLDYNFSSIAANGSLEVRGTGKGLPSFYYYLLCIPI